MPGPIDSSSSAGTHLLLRDGAVLVRGAEDILEELDGSSTLAGPPLAQPAPDLDDVQRRIWDYLARQARHMDEITRHLSLTVSQASNALVVLEMKKVVRRLPGNSYERR